MDSQDADDPTVDETTSQPRPRAGRLSLSSYDVGDTIGKGGMGEVLLAKDPRIGREVAIKRMVSAEPGSDDVARFLREAKIQACLEHPAIVPVHEIGHDADGRPYFTMKRLVGTTLHDVIRAKSETPQKLLRALVDVCLAVELAHTRGVVHRDLKPSNIMLGNFGEVYVLDWGVARVTSEAEVAGAAIAPPSGETAVGDVLGTPGYMAPEQIHDATQVDGKADVYSLGCMLYEVLAGAPLHPRGVAALASTLATALDLGPLRKLDVAPELETACAAALVREPTDRPSARELGDNIQRYLDGDRDLERRKSLAASYLAVARAAAGDPARRSEAMRAAGRAVGLDPTSEATAFVTRLLLEPPAEHPPALAHRLEELDRELSVRSARAAPMMMAIYFLVLPFLVWAGIKSWTWVFGLAGFIAVCAAWASYQARMRKTHDVANLFLGSLIVFGVGQIASPLLFVPAICCAMLMGIGQQAQLIQRGLWVLIVGGLIGFLAPLALELSGVIDPTFFVGEGKVTVTSKMLELGGMPTYLLLIVPNAGLIIVSAWLSRSLGTTRRETLRDGEVRAWHLQQLLPTET